MTVEIISWSISTKVWDRAGIELTNYENDLQLVILLYIQQQLVILIVYSTLLHYQWKLPLKMLSANFY